MKRAINSAARTSTRSGTAAGSDRICARGEDQDKDKGFPEFHPAVGQTAQVDDLGGGKGKRTNRASMVERPQPRMYAGNVKAKAESRAATAAGFQSLQSTLPKR